MARHAWIDWAAFLCTTIAVVLLVLNIFGEIFPAVHPKARHFSPTPFNPVYIPADEARSQLEQLEEEWEAISDDRRNRRVVEIISQSIVHYWPEPGERDFWMQMSPFDNYVLYVRDLFRDTEKYYEYYDYDSAIDRGVGLCSQAARAVSDYLREVHGITAGLIGLGGHVVAYAILPRRGMVILDADYNVYLPFGLKYAEAHPAIVRRAYEAKGHSRQDAAIIASMYADKGNTVREPVRNFNDESIKMRNALYMKWAIPAGLIVVAALLYARRPRASR